MASSRSSSSRSSRSSRSAAGLKRRPVVSRASSKRGFAAMSLPKRKAIASKGGRARKSA